MRRLVVLVAALTLAIAGEAVAQLSPGELSEAHAELEGAANCLECHAPGRGVAPERCLACHGTLRRRLAVGEGLHAQPDFHRCETCHIEHHGRSFELIFWGDEGRDAFDHRRAGWPLDGAHARTGCRDCHRPEHLTDVEALRAGNADPRTTFLGLSTSCTTCHLDAHRGQLATTCLDCHSTEQWTPAPKFDHDATGFPLRDAHAAVTCQDCHATLQDTHGSFLQVDGIAHSQCGDCHDDPHAGRLGTSCATCHTPTTWTRVDQHAFDHDRTRFPLTGRHRALACTTCHGGERPARQTLAFSSCNDCHADPHRGQLGTSCATCHSTTSWQRVASEAFDHDLTRFPLRGAHRTVGCDDCHTSGRRAGRRRELATCADCHTDVHHGQLRDAVTGGACDDCHTVERFVPSTFSTDDHARTRFPLDGAHLAVACVDCHQLTEVDALPAGLQFQRSGGRVVDPGPIRRFDFASTRCERCHTDPHGGDTVSLDLACTTCHHTGSFRGLVASASASDFDHGALTGFALEGGHRQLGCRDCHTGAAGAVRFGEIASTCASCHRDPHFGTRWQPDSAAVVACEDCHQIDSWQTTRFDHATDTGFSLEGAHASLTCAACHRLDSDADRLIPPPTSCEGCHGDASL